MVSPRAGAGGPDQSSGWRFCPLFWLRSAGFPLARLDELRLDDAVAAVDALLQGNGDGDGSDSVAGQQAAEEAAWAPVEDRFARDLERARLALRELLSNKRVQEAIFLSSPRFYETIRQHIPGPVPPRRSRMRQKEWTASRYLQRLFAKNDTVSFFGPLAWGRLERTDAQAVSLEPGRPELVGRRLVSLEHWAAQALARAVGGDPQVAAQLPPRLSPACRVEGRTLLYPLARRAELDDRWLAVLELCDGRTPWATLLEWLANHPAFATPGPAPEAVANELLARRIIEREILLPTVIANPERFLLERVAELDEPACSRWLARIGWFCAATDEFARAGFDQRRELLAEMGRRFTDLTGQPASRRPGEMYAARGLLYEDCERNLELRLGQPVLHRLQALAPLLDISRWLTGEVARRYEPLFRDAFRGLAAGRPAVDFALFVRETRWIADEEHIAAQLRDELAAAWAAALGDRWTAGVDELVITPADCAAVLARLSGGAPAEGAAQVLGARFHSPDLLIAAGPDEARAIGGTIVVGELHKAVFLAAQPVALPFCPDVDALYACVAAAVDGPVLSLVDSPRAYHRSDVNWPDLPFVHEIVTEGAASRFTGRRAVPIGAVEVVEEGGDLLVTTRDGDLRCGLLSVLSSFVQQKLLAIDPIELPADDSPRIVLGDLVVRRRRWQLDSRLLRDCPAPPDSAARLAWARRLRRRLGLPERVFARSPSEEKPIYVDFRNYFLVELLFKLAAEAPVLTVSEMLPGPDELWLHDKDGARYTAELRLTAYLLDGADQSAGGLPTPT